MASIWSSDGRIRPAERKAAAGSRRGAREFTVFYKLLNSQPLHYNSVLGVHYKEVILVTWMRSIGDVPWHLICVCVLQWDAIKILAASLECGEGGRVYFIIPQLMLLVSRTSIHSFTHSFKYIWWMPVSVLYNTLC